MAQILCILTISIIVGLSSIAKCNSLVLSSSGTQTENDGHDNDINVAKRIIFCINPNSKHPRYEHAVYFGERRIRSKIRRLWSKKYRKPLLKNGETPITVQAVFPSNSYSIFDFLTITYIQVQYHRNRDKQIYDDDVSIVDGGIGKNFVKLNMTSDNPRPKKYKVIIYGKFN